ncbi:MAG: flagellar hook-basal body protein [Dehalococcoidia bacterium]|nr:flagellar hook-basal body protein [Dehalococcoidia bacterium]
MLRGLYTAASSLLRMQRRQEVIAGNLANATTTGYRADVPEATGFVAVLQEKLGESLPVPPGWTGEGIGLVGTGVQPDRYLVDTRQGPLRQTDHPFDLALAGRGFFAVETPEGIAYTRDGSFRRSAAGQLVTAHGYPVLGVDGPIQLGPEPFTVARDGTIEQNGQAVGRLQVVDFAPRFSLPAAEGAVRLAAGAYTLGADGLLTRDGAAVARLSSLQVPGVAGTIQLAPGALVIAPDGSVTVNGALAGRLRAAAGLDPAQARRTTGTLLRVPEGGEAPAPVDDPQIAQYALEGSNVDLTKTMTDMLAVARIYEASQRALKLADEAAQRAVSEVGRLSA